MRITTLILFSTLLQVSAASFAQKVTLVKNNIALTEVFKAVKEQTGYIVLIGSDQLKTAKNIDVNLKNASLEEAFDQILKDQNWSYAIKDKSVVIKEKVPTFLEGLAERWAAIDAFGRIVDAEGKALPGATVKVKATGKGVSTDVKGNFHLKNVEEGAVLVVSYTGYISREVKAEKDMGSVMLEGSLSKLDEVQVIAYGTTTQRLSTGNVTTIKADVIEKQPVNNPLLALQGRVPGLFIEQATGFAGTGVKVRIQGTNSMNSGNDPLYVIDGIPFISQLQAGGNSILGRSGEPNGTSTYGNPLGFINPSDIESIDVLKDADATSIYGSRAANGAILITTKKGKSGDTKVDFNLQSGWGKVPNRLDLMNTEQYLTLRREALKNDGLVAPTPGPYGDSDLNGNWDISRNTDWQKELIGGNAGYHDFQASVSGGSNSTTFFIGAGYHKETNVFPGDFSDRKTSLHFNINNISRNQKFKIQFSGIYLYDNNQLPTIDFTLAAMSLSPNAPALYMSDGNINWQTDPSGGSMFYVNPLGYTYNKFLSENNNLSSNMAISYQLLPGLELKSMFGYTNFTTSSNVKFFPKSFYPELAQYLVRATTFGNTNMNSWSIEPQLSYMRNISKGKLELLLGSTIIQTNNKSKEVVAAGFSNDLVMDDILSATSLTANSSMGSVYKYNALFGKLNYNWQDKYVLSLTGRRDGSSRFGPLSQFHDFGAIGAAWIFSNEQIIKDHLSVLSFGKLRGSYGTTGNDQIGDYRFLSLYFPVSQELPYQGIPVYAPSVLTNPYLEWESTKKLQFGLDIGFFKDRILFNANYYENHSSNLLSGYTLPLTTGFSNVIRNQAYTIKNSGWELMLSTTNIQQKDFNWKASVNITIPKTLLVDYPDIIKSSAASTAIIGRPLSINTVYHFLGVDPQTGKYQFADKDGNPTFSPKDPQDKTKIIDLAAKFYGGVQNTFSYKGFQLDVLFSFVKQVGQNYSFGNGSPGFFNGGTGNQLASLSDRWQKPGDIVSIQKYTTGYDLDQSHADIVQSDAAWIDASYIRLKNLSLTWQLPDNYNKAIKLQNCRLFLQGQNLWTISSYSGLDPETKSSISLPILRVITMGVKANL